MANPQQVIWPGGSETTPTTSEIITPEGFWDMPDTFIDSPKIQQMYLDLKAKLLEENGDRDTIELMMVERAAALYAYMRNMEATQGYTNSQNYRHLAALWQTMANDLRKTRISNQDEARIREEVTVELVRAIDKAMMAFDVEVASTVRRRLITVLDAGSE